MIFTEDFSSRAITEVNQHKFLGIVIVKNLLNDTLSIFQVPTYLLNAMRGMNIIKCI